MKVDEMSLGLFPAVSKKIPVWLAFSTRFTTCLLSTTFYKLQIFLVWYIVQRNGNLKLKSVRGDGWWHGRGWNRLRVPIQGPVSECSTLFRNAFFCSWNWNSSVFIFSLTKTGPPTRCPKRLSPQYDNFTLVLRSATWFNDAATDIM